MSEWNVNNSVQHGLDYDNREYLPYITIISRYLKSGYTQDGHSMRILRPLISSLIAVLLLSSQVLAFENLDELEARTSRKTTNTFYSGEDGTTYVWQPQTVIYKDTSTNHEMILWTQSDGTVLGTRWGDGWEYDWQPWSADGKRIAFFANLDVGCYSRNSYPWFSARTDGTAWRPMCESSSRSVSRRKYPDWSPSIPEVAYVTGYNYEGNSGLDQNGVYREVFTDSDITSTLIVDMIPGNTSTARHGGLKDRITGDGLYLLEGNYLEDEPYYVVQIEPSGSRQLKVSWNLPTLDTYWGGTVNPADGHSHDSMVSGNTAHGYWFYFMPSGASDWWRIRLWGSDGGAPNHVQDHTSSGSPGYYTWWNDDGQGSDEWDETNQLPDSNKEVQAIGNEYDTGNIPGFATSISADFSHASPDRHGTYMVSSVDGAYRMPGALSLEGTSSQVSVQDTGTTYHAWTGWSDYFISNCGSSALCATLYNSFTASDHILIGEVHSALIGDYINPGQSPDGTKGSAKTTWLTGSSDGSLGNLIIGVAYYPYPPQITSVTASGGTVTVNFDWSSGKFTTRGWPDEDSDPPPPPRETDYFRLWRSSSGNDGTWTPLGTTDCTIFSLYDFSDGSGDHNGGWSVTDTPGDGTWYYGVTAVEHSGLESRSLSNVFSITLSSGAGTGSQSAAYPISPGTDSDFYGNTFVASNKSIIRHYNIYANDGSSPSVQQQDLIASISHNYDLDADGIIQWVDWLGDRGGTTNYVVAAVDTQGNVDTGSYVTNVSSTHRKSPATAAGQYIIEWDDMYRAYDLGFSPPSPPRNLRVASK